ncbi:MAG: DUF1905 domain-containing protein [Lachnospiraceae bacterium]|nr:DUF1905 domain-containing protein [Lachnospiraceae bacterium]
MNTRIYEFEAMIEPVPDKGGAYVRFPYDIKKEFGKGRVKVNATFNGFCYRGSLVNMGVKNPDGSICYIIGVRKDIQKEMQRYPGDTITVTIQETI